MDDSTESHSTIWSRLSRLFCRDSNEEKLEQAILDASAEGEVEPEEMTSSPSFNRPSSL